MSNDKLDKLIEEAGDGEWGDWSRGYMAGLLSARQALAAHDAEKQAGPVAGESYNDLFNALQRIDTAAVALPGFEVRHEGGLDAVVRNIVEAIERCASPPSDSDKAEPVASADAAVGPGMIGGEDAEVIRQRLRALDVAMGGDGYGVLSEVVDSAISVVSHASAQNTAPPSPLPEQDKEDVGMSCPFCSDGHMVERRSMICVSCKGGLVTEQQLSQNCAARAKLKGS